MNIQMNLLDTGLVVQTLSGNLILLGDHKKNIPFSSFVASRWSNIYRYWSVCCGIFLPRVIFNFA